MCIEMKINILYRLKWTFPLTMSHTYVDTFVVNSDFIVQVFSFKKCWFSMLHTCTESIQTYNREIITLSWLF